MALIPDEVVGEIRDRADVVAIIGEHVQLRKAGNSFKGLCPFHQEKTPSFHVNPARHAFYCFGCHKKGDVFGFLMELQGKSFGEVVREMAERTGIAIPERPATPEEMAKRSERSRLLDMNAVASAHFRALLAQSDAGWEYLRARGIGPEVAETFQLGFAADSWDGLVHHLESRRIPLESALTLGLVSRRQNGNGHYDRFRNRLVCPVILPAGEIVGFSGRTLSSGDPETPKYLNSPESQVYRKSHLLFGIHAARPNFARRGRALLVEGNFDVIALHQAGFVETVAPLGTALTPEQIDVLRRLAPSVVLCFDGDKAGRTAALRAIPLLQAAGVVARVVVLPDGEDPDSFVRGQGAAALEERVTNALPSVDYFLDQLWFRTDRSADARAAALREAAPLIAAVTDELKRELVIQQFARSLDVEPRLLRATVAAKLSPSGDLPSGQARVATPPPPAELKLFAILADHPDLLGDADDLGIRSLLTDARLRDMYSRRLAGQSFLDAAPPDISDFVAQEVLSGAYSRLANPRQTLVSAVRALQRDKLDQEDADINRAIKDAQRLGETTRVRDLILRQMETRRRAAELSRRPEDDPR